MWKDLSYNPLYAQHQAPSNYRISLDEKTLLDEAWVKVQNPPPHYKIVMDAIENLDTLLAWKGCGYYYMDYGIQVVPFVVTDVYNNYLSIIPRKNDTLQDRYFPESLAGGLRILHENYLQVEPNSIGNTMYLIRRELERIRLNP